MKKIPRTNPRLNQQSGFTLIEIIIVISLLATTYAFVLPDFSMRTGTDVATKLGRLAGDVRAAFDRSVLSGKPHRLVFHMMSGEYWLEETENLNVTMGNRLIDRDPDPREEQDRQRQFDEEFEEYVELAGEVVVDPETDEEIVPTSPVVQAREELRGPTWNKVTGTEWRKRTLGPGLTILDMQSEHHGRKVEYVNEGPDTIGMIYILPNGYIEKAVLHIFYVDGDTVREDQPPYTVTTEPWEGIAKIISGYEEVNVQPES